MDRLRVVITADLCPVDVLEEPLLQGDPARFIRPVADLFSRADLVIANLETPLCSSDTPIIKCGPNFRGSPAMAPVIKTMGIDLLTLCNNHINDQGTEGLKETIETLDAAGMPHCGAGLTHEDACRPAILQAGAFKVAVFNFGEGEFSRAVGNGPGSARLDMTSCLRVRKIRDDVDLVVVVLHTGNEFQPISSPLTTSFCRCMAEAGADAVVAHHAHIPQCTDIHDGVPICYGLGNFLFGEAYDESTFASLPSWYLGSAAELIFSEEGARVVLHPFKQVPDLTLADLSESGRRAFDEYMRRCREVTADPERHRRYWEQEVRELSRNLKSRLVSSAHALQNSEGAAERKAAAAWLNLRRCDAHHARITSAFRLLYEGRFDDDPDTAADLCELRALIKRCFD